MTFQSLSLFLSGCSSSSVAPSPALLEPLTRLNNQRTTLALVYGESAWGCGSRDVHVQARCCQPIVLGSRVQVGRRRRKQKASQSHRQRVTSFVLSAGLGEGALCYGDCPTNPASKTPFALMLLLTMLRQRLRMAAAAATGATPARTVAHLVSTPSLASLRATTQPQARLVPSIPASSRAFHNSGCAQVAPKRKGPPAPKLKTHSAAKKRFFPVVGSGRGHPGCVKFKRSSSNKQHLNSGMSSVRLNRLRGTQVVASGAMSRMLRRLLAPRI